MHVLQELLVIFAVAVVVVMALRKIGLPPIAGLIFAGVLLGPGVLGLVGINRGSELYTLHFVSKCKVQVSDTRF